jgi:hypothetical protein
VYLRISIKCVSVDKIIVIPNFKKSSNPTEDEFRVTSCIINTVSGTQPGRITIKRKGS